VWQLIVSVVLVSIYGFLAFVNFRDPVHSHAMLALTVRNSIPHSSMALSASSYPSFLTELIIHFACKISAVLHRGQQPDLTSGSIHPWATTSSGSNSLRELCMANLLQGMGVVAFAVIAGFGLTALCGISFSPLAGSVVPFLALGLGTLPDTNPNKISLSC
jgi:hypothetical protein